ncbi:hypothetical protein SAV31267_084110 [Streptomyces avermitilis]|uniref:HTH gntR-type domain-containing protein n=1 Tax=Streptomyces avermitilis TaxID=33903 RepID=A0A4D4N4V2_STRAX|nr:hypothetical protein SAVMC3_15820 [Streptomyces avermitilis]GDY78926.1 hypothetical protein SAV31267_084110 [Streptomyces avermitilis]
MARSTTSDHDPLYWRIAHDLLGELRDGTIPPGERLPGERHLATHFGVSRETVRQALQMLRRDGLVATDRRGSHATLPGATAEPGADAAHMPSLTFPVGAQTTEPCRATVTWEEPPRSTPWPWGSLRGGRRSYIATSRSRPTAAGCVRP